MDKIDVVLAAAEATAAANAAASWEDRKIGSKIGRTAKESSGSLVHLPGRKTSVMPKSLDLFEKEGADPSVNPAVASGPRPSFDVGAVYVKSGAERRTSKASSAKITGDGFTPLLTRHSYVADDDDDDDNEDDIVEDDADGNSLPLKSQPHRFAVKETPPSALRNPSTSAFAGSRSRAHTAPDASAGNRDDAAFYSNPHAHPLAHPLQPAPFDHRESTTTTTSTDAVSAYGVGHVAFGVSDVASRNRGASSARQDFPVSQSLNMIAEERTEGRTRLNSSSAEVVSGGGGCGGSGGGVGRTGAKGVTLGGVVISPAESSDLSTNSVETVEYTEPKLGGSAKPIYAQPHPPAMQNSQNRQRAFYVETIKTSSAGDVSERSKVKVVPAFSASAAENAGITASSPAFPVAVAAPHCGLEQTRIET